MITPAGVVTTIAGTAGVVGSADGTGRAAQFKWPQCVAVDSSGNVYVTEEGNNTVRKITPAGVVTTLAGKAGVVGSADGTGSAAQFNRLEGIAVDSSGNAYVGDSYNDTIRKITPAGVVTTVAGTAGVVGSADGTGSAAQFNVPMGVAVDENGNVYVADQLNDTIRIGVPVGGGGQVATPTFSPVTGTYTSTQSVTISCATSSTTIYYTTDGSTPTTSSSVYSGAITVSATTTINAIATATGFLPSKVASSTYTISSGGGGGNTPPPPTIDSPPVMPPPVMAGQPVALSVVASDPGVASLTYSWNFGDQTTGSGPTVTHTYAASGVYTATVTISNGVSSTTETVTVVISPANASQFALSKGSIKFAFGKTNADSMTFSGTLPIATNVVTSSMIFEAIIGGYTSNLTLNANGQGINTTDNLKLSGKRSKSGGYSISPVKFTYSVKNQALFSDLQTLGFSNTTVKAKYITVPILMILNGNGYLNNFSAVYTAIEGKTGSAK
jgi:hypothetical protein